jgi:hypothetical protein
MGCNKRLRQDGVRIARNRISKGQMSAMSEPETPAIPLPEPHVAEAPRKQLSPEAMRALQEAAERRAALDEKAKALGERREIAGRGGLDPVRYDDWDVKGLAVDF